MRSTVNILAGNTIRFPFLVEQFTDKTDSTEYLFRVCASSSILPQDPSYSGNPVYIDPQFVRYTNTWYPGDYGLDPVSNISVPKSYIRITVPDLNPSTYDKNVLFSVDLTTRIGLRKIVLSTVVFSASDLLTLERPFQDAGYDYHQYIDVTIPDPWYVCYGSSSEDFRSLYCFEPTGTNNCGSIVDIEINTVVKTYDTYEKTDCYILTENYQTGRTLILLEGPDNSMCDDYMQLTLSESLEGIIVEREKIPSYNCELKFNASYDGDISEYISETYGMTPDSLIYEMVLMDDENIYRIIDTGILEPVDSAVFDIRQLKPIGWNDYVEGMYAVATCRLFFDGSEIMDIRSNRLAMTPDRYARLMGATTIDNLTIDVELVNMEISKIDAVNKIVKNVVSVQRPEEYKSNMVRPVFYRAYEAAEITLHKSVNFNIGIDLDNYKTKVDNFTVQIEGVKFAEVARVPGYVIFSISGEKLPKESDTGTYYVLDGKGTLVTTGKYSYSD